METEMQRDRQRKRESYSEAPDVLWDQAQSNMEILAVHCSLNKHLHHKSDNEKKSLCFYSDNIKMACVFRQQIMTLHNGAQ